MFLRRLLGGGTLFLALVLATPAVKGQAEAVTSGLAQVPADAPIVIHLRGIEGTKDRLLAMLKTALPDQQPALKGALEGLLQNGIPGGRQLKGLSKDGPIFVVLTEMPDPTADPPKVAVLVAVTNYKEFIDGLLTKDERDDLKKGDDGVERTTINDKATYFIDRSKDGFAVITPDKDTAAKLVKKPSKGLDTKLTGDLAKRLGSGDLSFYLDMAAINKQYADQLKAAKEQAEKAIEAGNSDKASQEIAKRMIGPIFQAITDSEAILGSLEFRPEGLNLAGLGTVGAKSKTNDLLKDAKPGPVAELDKMPAGDQIYSAVQLSGALLKDFGGLVFGALGGKEGDPSVKALKQGLDLLADSKPKVQVGSSSLPPRGLTVWTCEDPAKAVQGVLTMYKGMKGGESIFSTPIKGEPVIKEKAEKYQGFELNYFSAKWDLEKLAEQQAGNPAAADKEKFIAYMKAIAGEGQNVWFGTDGKVVLTVIAKDFSEAKGLIDDYVKGGKPIGSDPTFKEVRKQLPAETTALWLIDLPSLSETMLTAMGPLLQGAGVPVPPNFGKPAAKGKPAYMGFAVTMQPQRGTVDVFLSAKAVNELYKMYFKGLLGGGGL